MKRQDRQQAAVPFPAGARIQGREAIVKRTQEYRSRHSGDRMRLTVTG
jgi:hypothetical protein